ncbi:hypothetical protein [Clostridium sp.]|uniref:hypothetical protein n=1 Tax=Clostridium sp. TaxID=1506 RepID=UPI0025C25F3D|nr:hypothetical protein [Clostridium sp.]
MNIKRITTHLLKLYRRKERILKAKYEDGYLVTDGYIIFYLKSNEMEINPELIRDDSRLINEWSKAIKNSYRLEYELSQKKYGKITDKYSNKEFGINVYIAENMFQFFDLYSIELYGRTPVSPVAVKKGEEIIAAICPIRMIDEF